MNVVAVVWMLLGGICIGVVYLWYTRRFLGAFVRKLIELDATSPETALSPQELNCKMTFALKNGLKEDGSLSGTVEKIGDRYYIPQKKLILASRKYREENTGGAFLILTVCILILAGVLFTFLYPHIQSSFEGLLPKQ